MPANLKKRYRFVADTLIAVIHTDAWTDGNVGMGIGILIPEAMISKSTIDKLASVDGKEILTVSDLVQEMFEYLDPKQSACRRSVTEAQSDRRSLSTPHTKWIKSDGHVSPTPDQMRMNKPT
jgi:hypothetical protein